MSPLVVSNLSHGFGGVQALDGVSLQLQAGERRAIIGWSRFDSFEANSLKNNEHKMRMVGPGDIAPAVTSMACVSNIARGRFEPQRLFRALSKP